MRDVVAVNQGAARALRPRAEDAPGWDKGHWRRCAPCRDEDPELFFPISSTGQALAQITEAKKVCVRCPVRKVCLRFALTTRQDHGIWGGLTEDERRNLRRRQ